jgi:hypothetical protein
MASRGYSSDFIETLRNKGDAIQLDQPDPGAVAGSAATIFLWEGEGDTLPAFVTVLVAGCIASYGTTILLFLPCLFLLSLERQMTGFKVCLLGLVLGAVE